MKNQIFIILTMSLLSLSSFAQKPKKPATAKKEEKTQAVTAAKIIASADKPVKAYHVEEKINMNFGARSTTYEVSDVNLISTNDLGPNNSRVVTPRYTAEKETPVTKAAAFEADKCDEATVKKKNYAYIDILQTYERVAEKGYQNIDMFKKMGNGYYFDAKLDRAARWYCELFAMTTELEPEYYYRYAQSLKYIGNDDEANEMMKKFAKLQ